MVEKNQTPKQKTTGSSAPKKRASRAKKPVQKMRGTCFVLMPFGGDYDGYFHAVFEPAVKTAKLNCDRADSLFRPSAIMSDVWALVQQADVLLADMTGKNANVFYELGLAHAIGKPVVLVSETMDDVPFDLRFYRVINYDKNNPEWGRVLKENISRALIETLDQPIDAVPEMFRKIVPSQAPEQDEVHARLERIERQLENSQRVPQPSLMQYTRKRSPQELQLIADTGGLGGLLSGLPRNVIGVDPSELEELSPEQDGLKGIWSSGEKDEN